MQMINESLEWIQNNSLMQALIWVIFFDIILGTARALIEKSFNSSVGKKGLIMKVSMVLAAICSVFIDYAVNFNISIIPKSIAEALGVAEAGLCETVIMLFALYECTSIVKNWSKLGLPFAKKLTALLEKYTGELK